MATDKEILKQFGEELLKNVKEVIPKATGKTAKSAELHMFGDYGLQIHADATVGALIDGRGPTKSNKQSDPSLHDRIVEWMAAKSIHAKIMEGQPQSKADLALSWAISKSIHNHGTKLYQRGGGNNIFDSIITKSRIDALAESLATNAATLVESTVLNLDKNGTLSFNEKEFKKQYRH